MSLADLMVDTVFAAEILARFLNFRCNFLWRLSIEDELASDSPYLLLREWTLVPERLELMPQPSMLPALGSYCTESMAWRFVEGSSFCGSISWSKSAGLGTEVEPT